MTLRVLDPGLSSRLVDLGRPRSRSLGVSVGGAADRAAFLLGNALVGNDPQRPALEIALKGPILKAEADVACVLFGAPFMIGVGAASSVRAGATFNLRAGDELHIGGTAKGMRGYLCARGGFESPFVLESASALEPLQAGDILVCPTSRLRGRFLAEDALRDLQREGATIRVVAGLQADWFDEKQFYEQHYAVTPALDRMGVRLAGAQMTMPGRELVSEPVCPGSVQITSDGQPILLGVDGQTIGGYPKIAQVIDADLDRLGQLRPGVTVRFEKVSLEEAVSLGRARSRTLADWTRRLQVSVDGW